MSQPVWVSTGLWQGTLRVSAVSVSGNINECVCQWVWEVRICRVCMCVCVYTCARSCPGELPSLPQGCCLRAWSSALLPTTTRCVKATTPRSGRGTQKCCPFAFLRGDCPDPQAPPIPPPIRTEAIRAQTLGPAPPWASVYPSVKWVEGR